MQSNGVLVPADRPWANISSRSSGRVRHRGSQPAGRKSPAEAGFDRVITGEHITWATSWRQRHERSSSTERNHTHSESAIDLRGSPRSGKLTNTLTHPASRCEERRSYAQRAAGILKVGPGRSPDAAYAANTRRFRPGSGQRESSTNATLSQ